VVTLKPPSHFVHQEASTRSRRPQSTSGHYFSVGTASQATRSFLAQLTSTDDYAMGFVAANLRVVLISTHVPLSQAIGLVRRERFEKTIRLAHHELQRWVSRTPACRCCP